MHRSAAALAAAEEEGASEPEQRVVGGGRGGAIVSVASVSTAGGEPTHTELSDERPHFDPVPVFIGPVPGWKGPVLAARPTEENRRAAGRRQRLCRRKAPAADDESANGQEADAPAVLKRAVRAPSLAHGPKRARNAALDRKSSRTAAVAKAAVATSGKNVLKKDVKSTTSN